MIRDFCTNETERLVTIWRQASAVAHPFLAKDFIEAEAENLRAIYLKFARTWVIEIEGVVVGFASVVDHELAGLFLDPHFHGQGFGRALVDKAMTEAGPLTVEVFEKNTSGRGFYHAYGFEYVAETVHDPTGETVLQLKFSR